MASSRGSFRPKDGTRVFCDSHIASRFFTAEPPGKSPDSSTRSQGFGVLREQSPDGGSPPQPSLLNPGPP